MWGQIGAFTTSIPLSPRQGLNRCQKFNTPDYSCSSSQRSSICCLHKLLSCNNGRELTRSIIESPQGFRCAATLSSLQNGINGSRRWFSRYTPSGLAPQQRMKQLIVTCPCSLKLCYLSVSDDCTGTPDDFSPSYNTPLISTIDDTRYDHLLSRWVPPRKAVSFRADTSVRA